MTPMRANIVGPPDVATGIKAFIAACHSAASCSAFGSFVMCLPASSSVTSWPPRGSGIGSSKRRFQPRSATGFDRLAQPLQGKFDILGLQMAPALDLSLVPILREALKVFRSVLSGGVAFPSEFLADKRIAWHGAIKAPRAAVGNHCVRT